MAQEIEWLLRVVWLKVSREIAIKTSAEMSEDLTRTGESSSKSAHSHGSWQEASVPQHVELSLGLLLKTWQLASPKASDPRE